jgi:hypothetical protein
MYALEYLKNLRSKDVKKGCYFEQQLTGEESIYHTLNFVNANQQLVRTCGEKEYLEGLRKTNAGSRCLQT